MEGRGRARAVLAVVALVVIVGGLVLATTSDRPVAVVAAVAVGVVLVYETVFWLRVASGRGERREVHRAR